MANFFAELKRRHIYRVAAGYAVVAWVLLQLVNNVTPIMAAPQWVAQFCLLVLVLGLPLAIFLAWTRELPPPETTSPGKTTATDWALIGALVVVIALVSYQQFVPAPGTKSAQQQASVTAARTASLNPGTAISLAVLPFVNLSSDKEQEFFSDGMTEEITAALAKVPDLRVVARTSAFEFKGKNVNIKTMGDALGATHLIEGSVRKAGNRLRITAQLIKADDGTHIWAEDYDRELTDVFAIQEDIARAITASLRMPLGLKPGENLVNNRSIDLQSYEQFLRGKAALLRARTAYAEQLAILEPVVAKNPNFAPGWAAVAQAYRYAAQFTRYTSPEEAKTVRAAYEAKMLAAARRSVELDPNLVDGKIMLARIQSGPRQVALAEDLLKDVLVSDPNNAAALDYYSNLLLGVGRIKEAVAMKQRVNQLEPYGPVYIGNLAQALWLDGQTDAAITMWKDSFNAEGAGATPGLTQIYASLGRFKDAADVLSQMAAMPRYQQFSDQVMVIRDLISSAPTKAPAPQKLPRLGDWSFVYLYIGAPDRALERYEDAREGFNDLSLMWHPDYTPVRKLERFKKVMREAGLVDYWRERGWPQWCHPTTSADFACN